jgi:hypothetical protein
MELCRERVSVVESALETIQRLREKGQFSIRPESDTSGGLVARAGITSFGWC